MKMLVGAALLGAILASGCCHALSKDARHDAISDVSLTDVKTNPGRYEGKTLLVGGLVTELTFLSGGSILELLQWRIDRWGEPTDVDKHGTRFLVKVDSELDPLLYPRGRLVTLSGTVRGMETRVIGTKTLHYPVLQLGEIYPWQTPYRYDLPPNPALNFPPRFDESDGRERTNPYDPGYYVHPFTRDDLRRRAL